MSDTASTSMPNSNVEIRRSEIAGQGLFAKQELLPGTSIFTEASIISSLKYMTAATLVNQILELDDAMVEKVRRIVNEKSTGSQRMGQKAFREALRSGSHEAVTAVAERILRVPSTYQTEMATNDHFHLCEILGQLNHSCTPNAEASWSGDHKNGEEKVVLMATSTIAAGSEIFVSYFLPFGYLRAERWRMLGFDCKCAECCLEGEQFKKSENKMRKRADLMNDVMEFRETHQLDGYDLFEVSKFGVKGSGHEDVVGSILSSIDSLFSDKSLFNNSVFAKVRNTAAAVYYSWWANATPGEDIDFQSFHDRALDMKREEGHLLSTCLGGESERAKRTVEEFRKMQRRQHNKKPEASATQMGTNNASTAGNDAAGSSTTHSDLTREELSSLDGIGLFATKHIQPGALIFLDKVLIEFYDLNNLAMRTNKDIISSIREMSDEDSTSLYHLAGHVAPSLCERGVIGFRRQIRTAETHDLVPLVHKLRDNLFPHESQRGWGHAFICEKVIKLNHSCLPNAYASWDSSTHQVRVIATKAIQSGDEISISYLGITAFKGRDERWKHLAFECNCEACRFDQTDQNERLLFKFRETERTCFAEFFSLALQVRNFYGRKDDELFKPTNMEIQRMVRDVEITEFLANYAHSGNDFVDKAPFLTAGLAILTDTIAAMQVALSTWGGSDGRNYRQRAIEMKRKEWEILKTCIGEGSESTLRTARHLKELEG